MPRILMVMFCSLAGCQTVGPFTQFSNQDITDFDLNSPEGWQRVQTEVRTLEIARTPQGSLVQVVDDRNRTFKGTLIFTDQKTVQLGDCLCQEIAPSRDGQRQAMRSHVPDQTFEIATLSYFAMISPPPPDFDVSKHGQNRGNSMVQAIVLKSGRILPWVEPEELASFSRNANQDELSDRIAAAMPGSQVSLIDEHGRRINGIVISTGPEEVELMNCLIREKISEADEPARHQTSHLPLQTFPASSLVSFAVVAPPPPDYVVPELGVDCEEYIVSEFVLESGRRLTWGKPENSAETDKGGLAWMNGIGKR